jgi:glycosyltransferase involved in cell wall biosynthesis
MDTFGLVYLEAMSMGIPIIASNVFALPEIVGKAGMLVDIGKYSWFGKDNLFAYKSWSEMERKLVMDEKPQITLQIERSLARLMDSRHLRERLGKAGRKEILKGKFSINNRNEKLRRIYEEALRR